MWCKEKKYKEKLLWIVGNFKICTTFATANEKNGSLDEWLSQRSAKPCTAVRIRQEPHEALSDVFWKGFSLLLIENGTTLVLQNMISGWCFEERLFFIPRFLLFFRFVYSGSSQHIGNILQFRKKIIPLSCSSIYQSPLKNKRG